MPKEEKEKVSRKTAASGEKKVKAKKDPNAPKGKMSGYQFFSADQRSKVKKENPDATFGTLS
jgi:hypothetical protein